MLAWVAAVGLMRRGHIVVAGTTGMLEVLVHAAVVVLVLGWDSGFGFYILVLFPVLFLISGRMVFKVILLLIVSTTLVWLVLHAPARTLVIDPQIARVLQVGNLTGVATLLALWSQRYRVIASSLDEELRQEHRRSEALLHNILPKEVAQRLEGGEEVIADQFEMASVLFADLVGFTELSARLDPKQLVVLLNDVFSRLDRLAARHGLEKIKTIVAQSASSPSCAGP